jgi:hypothetical protein
MWLLGGKMAMRCSREIVMMIGADKEGRGLSESRMNGTACLNSFLSMNGA